MANYTNHINLAQKNRDFPTQSLMQNGPVMMKHCSDENEHWIVSKEAEMGFRIIWKSAILFCLGPMK